MLADPDALEKYSWRNHRLEFYRCARCGCITHYERANKRADGSDMGAVNLRNVDDPSIVSDLPIRSLDGASSWKVLDEAPQPNLLSSPED